VAVYNYMKLQVIRQKAALSTGKDAEKHWADPDIKDVPVGTGKSNGQYSNFGCVLCPVCSFCSSLNSFRCKPVALGVLWTSAALPVSEGVTSTAWRLASNAIVTKKALPC
jgi:hypothetical protein